VSCSAYILPERLDLIRTLVILEENPKFGREATTTWKAGPSSGSVRRGIIFVPSKKLPGPKNVSIHLQNSKEGSSTLTSMNKNERHCIFDITANMQKMDINISELLDLHFGFELRKLVQLCFGCMPIKARFPIRYEALEVGSGI
jgi:hypothetical protein